MDIQEGLVYVKVRKIQIFLKGQLGSSLPFFLYFHYMQKGTVCTGYKALRAKKAEKGNTLCEILAPTSKGIPDFLLGFDANQPKLFLEGRFPVVKFLTCQCSGIVIAQL